MRRATRPKEPTCGLLRNLHFPAHSFLDVIYGTKCLRAKLVQTSLRIIVCVMRFGGRATDLKRLHVYLASFQEPLRTGASLPMNVRNETTTVLYF